MDHHTAVQQLRTIHSNFARTFGIEIPTTPSSRVSKVKPSVDPIAPKVVARKRAAASREYMARQPKGVGYQVGFSNAECTMALRKSKGNITHAAKMLGVTVSSVLYRINNFAGVFPKGFKRLGRGRPRKAA